VGLLLKFYKTEVVKKNLNDKWQYMKEETACKKIISRNKITELKI